jgi:hypothetical protein
VLHSSEPGLNPAAEDSPSAGTVNVAEIRAALARVQSRLPNCDEIKQWTFESLLRQSKPELQHFITAELAKEDLKTVSNSFPDTTEGRQKRAEFLECGAPKVGA